MPPFVVCPFMNKHAGLIIALTGFSLASLAGQSSAPSATPEASPTVAKHRHSKKQTAAEKAASPSMAATTATSEPSPAVKKRKHTKKGPTSEATAAPATSPTAPSPSPARRSWFQRMVSPTPANAPVGVTSPPARTSTTAQTTKPLPPTSEPVSGGGPGMVWVNTESHIYHKEGSRWYGKTKKGKYMSEQDALKEGNHADKEEGE